jgi:hypothetical protein
MTRTEGKTTGNFDGEMGRMGLQRKLVGPTGNDLQEIGMDGGVNWGKSRLIPSWRSYDKKLN